MTWHRDTPIQYTYWIKRDKEEENKGGREEENKPFLGFVGLLTSVLAKDAVLSASEAPTPPPRTSLTYWVGFFFLKVEEVITVGCWRKCSY